MAVACVALVVAEGAVGKPQGALVASTASCPFSDSLTASLAQRRAALMCLVNHARNASGLPAVRRSQGLTGVADAKARDVVNCSDFSHEACGKHAFAYVQSSGLPYSFVGENLFYSQRPIGTARDVFVAWLASPPHRRLLFLGRFSHAGTAVVEVERFSGTSRVELWVLELGQRARLGLKRLRRPEESACRC